jgi:hypothetical protein
MDELTESQRATYNSWVHFTSQVNFFQEYYPKDSRLKSSQQRLDQLKPRIELIKENYPELFI